MNDDIISRQAAIDVLSVGEELLSRVLEDTEVVGNVRDKYEWGLELLKSCISDIEALQPAQAEPQWIPVSERLPEVGRSVLFSRRSMDTREGCLQADGKWWQYRWNEMLNVDQVAAWMPLPEPYRTERRSDGSD